MNFRTFKHLFSETRRPRFDEMILAKDGILACPECESLGIVVSAAYDSLAHGHCPSCKFTGILNNIR